MTDYNKQHHTNSLARKELLDWHLVGDVKCYNISKFNETDTNTSMLRHNCVIFINISKFLCHWNGGINDIKYEKSFNSYIENYTYDMYI